MRARWKGIDPDRAPSSIDEIVESARLRLPPHLWDHAAGGAGTEATLRRNSETLTRVLLRPRVLSGVAEDPDTTTTVLGTPVALPILLAPVGPLELYDPAGALASARAAHRAGTMSFVSATSSPSLDVVAKKAAGPLVFQLYVRGDRRWVEDTVTRAAEAGYRALCLTVDAPVYGRRERDIAHRFVHTDHIALPNLPPERRASDEPLEHELVHQGALTWSDVDWIAGLTDLPLILKGVMGPEDARLAVEHGAQAVYLSNHGGRLLDHMQAPIEVLPAVLDEVGDEAEILIDGGYRHGEDVVKALALGARAVLIGKLQCWGLASGGEDGVVHLLELMGEELNRTLPQLGVGSVRDLGSEHVVVAP